MTTPQPNLITYPAWYDGGYPDVEALMQSLFQPLLGGVQVVTWFPTPDAYEAQLGAGYGYLLIRRVGGKVNHDQNRDEPRVLFGALTRIRDESWQLIEFVRQTLECFNGHGGIIPGTTTSLSAAGEIVGPALAPELVQDNRFVPTTFELIVKRPKGFPIQEYRQALGL